MLPETPCLLIFRGRPLARKTISVSSLRICPTDASDAIGVGNDEHPVTEVRGTKGGRWDAVPLSVIPERGQVSENVAHSSNKEPWDVLQEREAGS